MYDIKKLDTYKFLEHKFNYKNFITPGLIGTSNQKLLNTEIKDSLDLTISPNDFNEPFLEYRICISKIIKLYEKKYDELANLNSYNVFEGYNIQYYKPKAGFKKWHNERSMSKNSKRLLVFMTYLNDVPDGGTEFKYQNIITPAKKGLTLLWPVDWTHTHKGQISKTNEKFIITGWLSF